MLFMFYMAFKKTGLKEPVKKKRVKDKTIMVTQSLKDQLDACSIADRRDSYETIVLKLLAFYDKHVGCKK